MASRSLGTTEAVVELQSRSLVPSIYVFGDSIVDVGNNNFLDVGNNNFLGDSIVDVGNNNFLDIGNNNFLPQTT